MVVGSEGSRLRVFVFYFGNEGQLGFVKEAQSFFLIILIPC